MPPLRQGGLRGCQGHRHLIRPVCAYDLPGSGENLPSGHIIEENQHLQPLIVPCPKGRLERERNGTISDQDPPCLRGGNPVHSRSKEG
jgi:hypothetical protein